jgi:hypothetical protein
MKLKELIERLQVFRDECDAGDWEACIPISGEGGIGGHSVVSIKQTAMGFDWNHGKVFLYPMNPLFKKPQKPKK